MKTRLCQIGLATGIVALGITLWDRGATASVKPPVEIEITAADLPGSQRWVEPVVAYAPATPEAEYFALKATRCSLAAAKGQLVSSGFEAHRMRPTATIMAVVLRGLAICATGPVTPPPPPSWARAYPVQPGLDVSWSLQGLADEEDQGGEGDIIEYYSGGS